MNKQQDLLKKIRRYGLDAEEAISSSLSDFIKRNNIRIKGNVPLYNNAMTSLFSAALAKPTFTIAENMISAHEASKFLKQEYPALKEVASQVLKTYDDYGIDYLKKHINTDRFTGSSHHLLDPKTWGWRDMPKGYTPLFHDHLDIREANKVFAKLTKMMSSKNTDKPTREALYEVLESLIKNYKKSMGGLTNRGLRRGFLSGGHLKGFFRPPKGSISNKATLIAAILGPILFNALSYGKTALGY